MLFFVDGKKQETRSGSLMNVLVMLMLLLLVLMLLAAILAAETVVTNVVSESVVKFDARRLALEAVVSLFLYPCW